MPQVPDTTPDASELIADMPKITFKGLKLAARTARALEDMAYKGLPLTHVAEIHGIRQDNLQRAFRSPRVRAVYNQIVKTLRENAGQQAYLRNIQLSVTSESDHVKADLNKWIAGVDGIAALKKVEGKYTVSHSFGGFEYDPPDVINGTSEPVDDDDQGE